MPTKAREQVGGAHRTPMKVPLTKRQLMKPILVFFHARGNRRVTERVLSGKETAGQ